MGNCVDRERGYGGVVMREENWVCGEKGGVR